jgi:truncated hemoglobin YjbI
MAGGKFSIDEVNLYEQLGHEKFVELSTCFYGKVYADTEPSFRGMFPKDKDSAIQNQCEFFIQRMGGPPHYSERKGHPALRDRHARFAITRAHAEKWLTYMREAMAEVGIPEDARARMDEYFTEVAYFLQNVGEDGERLY